MSVLKVDTSSVRKGVHFSRIWTFIIPLSGPFPIRTVFLGEGIRTPWPRVCLDSINWRIT